MEDNIEKQAENNLPDDFDPSKISPALREYYKARNAFFEKYGNKLLEEKNKKPIKPKW